VNDKKKKFTAAGAGLFPESMLAADFLTNEPSDVCKRIYTKNFLKIMI
jgi:hypothetical protein